MIRLVRPFDGTPRYSACLAVKRSQLHADLLQVQPGHLFVQLLGQRIDADLLCVPVLPQIELRQRLVGEAVAHDETGVAGGAAEIHQASFGQQEDAVAVRESVHIHLRLDVGPFHAGRR